MTDCDVLIIGGGISGLATAWWLVQEGLSVEVWEASDRAGGKIMSTQRDGYLTERAASMVMNFRPEVVELVRAAGLEQAKTARMPAAETRRYLLQKGQLRALPMRMGPMLASPLWSLRGKLRMLAEPFIPAGRHEDESVSDFITRRLGREVLEKAMEPFVAGTLAADPDRTSAAAALPRLTALERRYGSITAGVLVNRLLRRRTACQTDTFSFNGGMGTLVAALARTSGMILHTGYHVEQLISKGDAWEVTATTPQGQRTLSARQVVVATPASKAASLLSSLDTELEELLRGINYASLAVVHIGMDRSAVGHPLDGSGFLASRTESPMLTGNLWMSTLFPDRAPPGKVLVSSYLGGARAPQILDRDDAHILDDALAALCPLLGIKADPEMVRIDRHWQALPLYHGAYQKRMHAIAQRLQQHPGLYLEANYRGGVSVRDRLARGYALRQYILARAQQSSFLKQGKVNQKQKLVNKVTSPLA